MIEKLSSTISIHGNKEKGNIKLHKNNKCFLVKINKEDEKVLKNIVRNN